MTDPFSVPLETVARKNGVALRQRGEGAPVFVVPGAEGSGESCLHLALPVLDGAPGRRLVLVDYGAEAHPTFDALAETVAGLVAEAADGGPCRVWAQSFGNLLAVRLAGRVEAERWALVSPFTRLPAWKAHLGTLSLAVTPRPLYRATSPPLSRWLFGPAGDASGHPFFDALREAPPGDVRRRTAWLRGRDAEPEFAALAGPVHVWLGARDRLIDLDDQRRRFAALAEARPDRHLSMLPSGHVVLDSAAAEVARAQIAAWITA